MAFIEANKNNVEQSRRMQQKMAAGEAGSVPPEIIQSEAVEEKPGSATDGRQ